MIPLQKTVTTQNTAYRHILVGQDREEILVPTVFDKVILTALQNIHVNLSVTAAKPKVDNNRKFTYLCQPIKQINLYYSKYK